MQGIRNVRYRMRDRWCCPWFSRREMGVNPASLAKGVHREVGTAKAPILARPRRPTYFDSPFCLSGGLYVPQSPVLDSVPVFYSATVSQLCLDSTFFFFFLFWFNAGAHVCFSASVLFPQDSGYHTSCRRGSRRQTSCSKDNPLASNGLDKRMSRFGGTKAVAFTFISALQPP